MSENPKIARRQAAMLATAALVGCADGSAARAQGASTPSAGPVRYPAPTNVVLPVPVPCISRPDDIVGMTIEGPSEATILVIGQAFRPGDLPRDAGLQARLANGAALDTQFDLKVRHLDGSARHGIVSIAVPALGRGERRGIILSRSAPAATGALDAAAALGGRQATLDVTPLVSGEPWQVDLLALWQRNLQAQLWQSGPLVVQGRVSVPVPASAIGGATSMRLVADIAVRADGTLWTDVWLRNDIAQRPGGATAAYTAVLKIDGREVLNAELPEHRQYVAFGRIRGARRGGAAPPNAPFFRHDVTYLAETASLPRFDQSTGAESRALEGWAQQLSQPEWDVPLAHRMVQLSSMGGAGGRPDIGPVTGWQSHWLCSGDRRAAAVVLGQAETAGAVVWHIWDATAGHWLDTRAWPRLWADPRGGPPPTGLLQPLTRNAVRSHQPDLSYVPYLLTGRQAFLDELTAQAAWNFVVINEGERRESGPAGILRGVNLINLGQGRSMAWSIRTLENAAWITPDSNPQAQFFRDAAATNWNWARSKMREWTQIQGEAHGWVPVVYNMNGGASPWQQDMFASSVAWAARRGNADALALLQWMSNFIVGRYFVEDRGFLRRDAAANVIAFRPENQHQPFRTWSEMGSATLARGWSNEATWRHSGGDYSRWALQALAQIHEVLEDPRALEAYNWLLESGAPFTDPQTFARDSRLNVVPKGMPRVPSRQLQCTG